MSDEAWTRQRLESMIAQKIEESPHLEYKSAGALDRSERKRLDITKDVSAFANSAGGRILYGVHEFQDDARKHLPEKIDAIDSRDYSREWLEQIIHGINPRIHGLTITPVRVGPADWDTCYVVDIPKGETAHQATDCCYYKRYNFKLLPMPDHEVRDVMNRRKYPKLDFRARLKKGLNTSLDLTFMIRNLGRVVPLRYAVVVQIPVRIGNFKLFAWLNEKGPLDPNKPVHLVIEGNHFWRFMVEGREPVFPETDAYCASEVRCSIETASDQVADYMICTLYADEMPGVTRKVPVQSALKDWA